MPGSAVRDFRVAALLVLFVGICAHAGALFMMPFDDNVISIALGAQPLANILTGSTFGPTFPVYRPIAFVTLHWQMQLLGIHVPAIIFANLLLVVAFALAAMAIARRLGASPALALAYACIVVVSPLWQTALANLGERTGACAACFGILALLAAMIATDHPAGDRRARGFEAASMALMLLAALSKEPGMAFAPAVLLFLRFGGRSWLHAFAVAGAPVLVYVALRQWQLDGALLAGRVDALTGIGEQPAAVAWSDLARRMAGIVGLNLVGPILAPMFSIDGIYRGLLPSWDAPIGYLVTALFALGVAWEPRRSLPFLAIILGNAVICFTEYGAERNQIPAYLAKYQVALFAVSRMAARLDLLPGGGQPVRLLALAAILAVLSHRIVLGNYEYQLLSDGAARRGPMLREAGAAAVGYPRLEPLIAKLLPPLLDACSGPRRYCVVARRDLVED